MTAFPIDKFSYINTGRISDKRSPWLRVHRQERPAWNIDVGSGW